MGILRLKEVMAQKEISREDLAAKVNVSKTTISNICTENNLPTIKLLIEIAQALDVDIRELFIPTKGGIITQNEAHEATMLLTKAIELLKKK